MKIARDRRVDLLLDDVQYEVRETRGLTGRQALDSRVLDALRRVPRHAFVAEALQERAYDDNPLPIGNGQTISQPYIVALMTDLIGPRDDAVVLYPRVAWLPAWRARQSRAACRTSHQPGSVYIVFPAWRCVWHYAHGVYLQALDTWFWVAIMLW